MIAVESSWFSAQFMIGVISAIGQLIESVNLKTKVFSNFIYYFIVIYDCLSLRLIKRKKEMWL